MPFDQSINHAISLADAERFTGRFRSQAGPNAMLAGAIDKESVLKILNQSGCAGIRIYNAISDSNQQNFVICGVDSNMEDMYNGILMDYCYTCPPLCPHGSPLAQ